MLVHGCWSSGRIFLRSNALQNVDFPALRSPVTRTLLDVSSIRSRRESKCLMLWLTLPSSKEAIEFFSREWTSSDCDNAPSLRSSFSIENSWAICGVTNLGSAEVLLSTVRLFGSPLMFSASDVTARCKVLGLREVLEAGYARLS